LCSWELARSIGHAFGCGLWFSRELRIYRYDLSQLADAPRAPEWKKNCVRDLLLHAPSQSGRPSQQHFLRRSLHRMENGCVVLTRSDGGKLVGYSWMIPLQDRAQLSKGSPDMPLPPRSAVVFDCYTDLSLRGTGLQQAALVETLLEARAMGHDYAFIWLLSNDTALRRAVESIPFAHVGSRSLDRRLWRVQAESQPLAANPEDQRS
jgi:hypothetical protein